MCAGRGDDTDLLPASGLVTSSEDYYPTVAINALMRVLRDPAMATQHMKVIEALMTIFRSLSLAAVPYLPKLYIQDKSTLRFQVSQENALSVLLLDGKTHEMRTPHVRHLVGRGDRRPALPALLRPRSHLGLVCQNVRGWGCRHPDQVLQAHQISCTWGNRN
eukprot:1162062-Pelagomonas_calceolata.AAC.28